MEYEKLKIIINKRMPLKYKTGMIRKKGKEDYNCLTFYSRKNHRITPVPKAMGYIPAVMDLMIRNRDEDLIPDALIVGFLANYSSTLTQNATLRKLYEIACGVLARSGYPCPNVKLGRFFDLSVEDSLVIRFSLHDKKKYAALNEEKLAKMILKAANSIYSKYEIVAFKDDQGNQLRFAKSRMSFNK